MNKISFRPYHGKPFRHYTIYRQNPQGWVKYTGKMIAPNGDLALAKAKENFGHILGRGVTLYVRRRRVRRRFV